MKAAGLGGCSVECLKSTSVMEWLIRLLSVCFIISLAPNDARND